MIHFSLEDSFLVFRPRENLVSFLLCLSTSYTYEHCSRKINIFTVERASDSQLNKENSVKSLFFKRNEEEEEMSTKKETGCARKYKS